MELGEHNLVRKGIILYTNCTNTSASRMQDFFYLEINFALLKSLNIIQNLL